MLTAFIIDLVNEVDSSVGPFLGESWLMRAREGKVYLGPLREEAYKEFKWKVRARRLIRRLWLACDELGEERVKEALRGCWSGELAKQDREFFSGNISTPVDVSRHKDDRDFLRSVWWGAIRLCGKRPCGVEGLRLS